MEWTKYLNASPHPYKIVVVKATKTRKEFEAYYGYDEFSGWNWIGVSGDYKDLCFVCVPSDYWKYK